MRLFLLQLKISLIKSIIYVKCTEYKPALSEELFLE